MFQRLIPLRFRKSVPVVNLVRLHGAIGVGTPMKPPLLFKDINDVLEKAFRKGIAAVALAVNSPGGSPVQSALIHARIRALATEHKLPVYVFCEDVAASGGYWLACA
ncbi:MAG: S49 family peptidase, partial [Alphaproteobacteria bacterium]|nr:S49 family peptidase [Alphaproteobacteria bacterium]